MDGILLVNKPKDMTSRDVVNILSKKFNLRSIGHTGTLDPIATGVLGIASTLLASIASYAGSIILMPYITFSILAFYRDLEEEKEPRAYVNATVGTAGQVQTNATVVGANTVNNNINNSQPVNNEQTTSNINNNVVQETVKPENTNNIVNSTVAAGSKKYCKRCGAENTLDATYCTSCGAKLD